MRSANLLAALRQLSVANLPGKAAWLAALPVLRELVPFEHDALLWFDADSNVVDLQIESPEGLAQIPHYLANFHESREREAMPTFREFMCSGQNCETPSQLPGFHQSDFYQEVIRPLGVQHVTRLAIRQGEAPVAATWLGRQGGFRSGELDQFMRLVPLLTHLLGAPGEVCVGQGDAESQQMLITDEAGHIHFASASALFLLCRASGRGAWAATLNNPPLDLFRPLIQDLARRVARLESGRSARAPAQALHRADGTYWLRGYRLTEMHGGRRLIAIQLEYQLPLLVRLYRAGRLQTLAPREQQLVPLALVGMAAPELARTLGLRRHTVNAYLRNLYLRLGISRREELLGALLGPPASDLPSRRSG